MKLCKTCRVEKPLEEFYGNTGTRDKRASSCKECAIEASVARQRANPAKARATQKRWRQRNPEKCREKTLRFARENPEKVRAWRKAWSAANPEKMFARALKIFGLTPADYRTLLASQGGVCAICQRAEKTGNRLAVDHDHASGRVRGLLCRDCNTSLGKFHDSPGIVRRAADYLDGHALSFPVNKNNTNNQERTNT